MTTMEMRAMVKYPFISYWRFKVLAVLVFNRDDAIQPEIFPSDVRTPVQVPNGQVHHRICRLAQHGAVLAHGGQQAF